MVKPSFNVSQEAFLSAGSLYDPTVLHVLISDDSSYDLTHEARMAFQTPFSLLDRNQAVLKCEFVLLRQFAKITNIFPKSGFSHIMTHFRRKLFDAGFRWKIRSKMNSFLKIYKTQ